MSEATVGEARCAACDKGLFGRYCHACGQDSRAKPQPLKAMAVEVATSYSPIDSKMARTIAALLFRPHRLLNAYRSGAGSLYVTPLKLFVAATALFLALLNFSNVTLYQYVWKVTPGQAQVASIDKDGLVVVAGAKDESRWLQARIEPAIDPPILEALRKAQAAATSPSDRAAYAYEFSANEEEVKFAERVSAWLPNVLWVLMPIYAAGLMLFFGRKRLFLEHVIFAMWAHAVSFVLMMLLAGLNSRGANLPAWLLAFPYLGYFTIAAARYYETGWLSALWRGVAHMALYLFGVLLPAALIVYMTVLDWNVWWAWISA